MPLYDDPRSAWTDLVPTGRVDVDPAARTGVRWHWAGDPTRLTAASAHTSCLSLVKSFEAYHMSKGWNSIGYNALICPHARVIEGRGFDYRGAHSGSVAGNTDTYGVQFMVGTGELVSPAMFDRAYYLERDLWEHSGKTLTSDGHRDDPSASTSCPGDQIYSWAHQPHTLSEVDMKFEDIVPGTNPPLTVGQCLARGAYGYGQVVEGGSIDKRLDTLEAKVAGIPAQVEALVEGATYTVTVDVKPA